MNKLSSMQKLWLPLSIGLIALLCITIFGAYQGFQVRMEERKNDLTNVAHAGMSIVRDYASLAQKGVLPTAEAQKQALERLRSIRYGDDGYILVINSKPVMLMHPIQPGLVGHDMANDADADGRHHYVAFVRAAQAANGGFVDYVFAHARGTVAVPKIGYVLRFAPWDWILSTGCCSSTLICWGENDLHVLDRGYPASWLMAALQMRTIKFCMRIGRIGGAGCRRSLRPSRDDTAAACSPGPREHHTLTITFIESNLLSEAISKAC
jgi:hypothetical protein